MPKGLKARTMFSSQPPCDSITHHALYVLDTDTGLQTDSITGAEAKTQQAPGTEEMERAFSPHGVLAPVLGRWPRLVCRRAFGSEPQESFLPGSEPSAPGPLPALNP